MQKEKPSEFVIEITEWTLQYAFWVESNKRRRPRDPYFDSLYVELTGGVVVPSSAQYATAKISMGHHDGYGTEIDTTDPHPIIGHVHFKKPVLEGNFSVPHRIIELILRAVDRRATRFLYLATEPLKRNKAHVRSVMFEPEIDLEDYSDPTRGRKRGGWSRRAVVNALKRRGHGRLEDSPYALY